MSKWYRLDNAAKIFPPSKNKYDAKIFRFSVNLKEKVEKEILIQSLELTLKEYPVFSSVLKRGFFWYYLEESTLTPKVREESGIPCSKFKSNLLFEVTYYNKRINLEVSHALTDGTGTLMFLKTLVSNYLNLKYKIKDREVINYGSVKEVREDAFLKYHQKGLGHSLKGKRAYQIKDDKYIENHLKVIEGIASVNKVKEAAHKYDLTITQYLTSILIISIAKSYKVTKRPIAITVPVNLRNYYPSYTVRNFFSVVNICCKDNLTNFEEVAKCVKNAFKENLSKNNIQNKMNNMIALENIFILRLVPIFLKDIVLRIASFISDKYQTMTLSNIGVVSMPKVYHEYIDYFDVFISTSKIQLCTCSYLDKIVLSFSSQFETSEIERNFFRYLSNEGIDIDIKTNKGGI